MNMYEARRIIRSLAEGINPTTGEILPETDSCNEPQVIRAFHAVLAALEPRESDVTRPENAGKPWSAEDDAFLCKMFDENKTPRMISRHFKRTDGAITSRLSKLGKL